MRKILALSAVVVLGSAPSALAFHGPLRGSGSARPAGILMHHRSFRLATARVRVERYEHGLPVRIGACYWTMAWEAACPVRFHGQIFTQSSRPATFMWTDLVAKFTPDLWRLTGVYSVRSVDLRQVGTIQVTG